MSKLSNKAQAAERSAIARKAWKTRKANRQTLKAIPTNEPLTKAEVKEFYAIIDGMNGHDARAALKSLVDIAAAVSNVKD